jgi:MFS family permease
VLELTDSGTAVGLITAALFVPSLLFGAWAGALADRLDARRALIAIQLFLAAQGVVLAAVVFAGAEALWLLVLIALWNGVGGAIDRPLRQTLMNELVGDRELPNAIATNSALVQLGLISGPAVGAVLISTVGIAWCFAVNAATYAAMAVAIASIRPSAMYPRERATGGDTSVRAGLANLRTRPDLRMLLIVLALLSMLAYRVDVLAPLLAKELGGESGLFAGISVARGSGALVASVFLASRFGVASVRLLRNGLIVLGVSLCLMAIPMRAFAIAAAVPVGLGYMTTLVCTLSLTQLLADAEFRGRQVALWFVVLSGGVVFGSLLVGAVADLIGAGWMTAVAGSSIAVLVVHVSRHGQVPTGPTNRRRWLMN